MEFAKTPFELQETRLDLLKYRGKKKVWESDLKRVKDELSKYERRKFVSVTK